jgi:hypothetical protein
MWRIGRAPNIIPIYIQQDATLHSLFISGNCSTCFGWYFHPSSIRHTPVSTASGIYHTVTAIYRYRGRVGTDLSALWVAYPLVQSLSACTRVTFTFYLFRQHFGIRTLSLTSRSHIQFMFCQSERPSFAPV